VALGPEQVEEEGGSEDGGDVDADEDVEGGDADEVVVVNIGGGVLLGEKVLLVDIVYAMLEVYQRSVSRYMPDSAAVPKLSLTTHKIMASW
jgi:hypothetical protein